MRLRPCCILLAAATAASANSVREEAIVNTIQPTPANPRSSSFTDSLSGTIDLSSQWSLNLGGNVTLQGRTPASQRGQFPESGSIVTLFTGGADWNVTDNLALDKAGVQLDEKKRVKVDAHLRTHVSGIWAIGDVVAGPMLAQFQAQHATLLAMDEDALLKPFRQASGLPAPGDDLGGWYSASASFKVCAWFVALRVATSSCACVPRKSM